MAAFSFSTSVFTVHTSLQKIGQRQEFAGDAWIFEFEREDGVATHPSSVDVVVGGEFAGADC